METKFRETFDLPKDQHICITKLEDALIKKYGDFKIIYFKGWKTTDDYGMIEEYKPYYKCMCGETWGIYKYETKNNYNTSKDAVLGLFIENKNKLKGIVKNVIKI